jgi:hypothetical protein
MTSPTYLSIFSFLHVNQLFDYYGYVMNYLTTVIAQNVSPFLRGIGGEKKETKKSLMTELHDSRGTKYSQNF